MNEYPVIKKHKSKRANVRKMDFVIGVAVVTECWFSAVFPGLFDILFFQQETSRVIPR